MIQIVDDLREELSVPGVVCPFEVFDLDFTRYREPHTADEAILDLLENDDWEPIMECVHRRLPAEEEEEEEGGGEEEGEGEYVVKKRRFRKKGRNVSVLDSDADTHEDDTQFTA